MMAISQLLLPMAIDNVYPLFICTRDLQSDSRSSREDDVKNNVKRLLKRSSDLAFCRVLCDVL
jgi:hypothetical protein